MSEEEIIDQIADFLSSDEWWDPILDFKAEKCIYFHNSDNPTFEDFEYYSQFKQLIVDLIDSKMCISLALTHDKFENIVFSQYEKESFRAKTIIETLKKTLDFEKFRQDMIRFNEEDEEEEEEEYIESNENNELIKEIEKNKKEQENLFIPHEPIKPSISQQNQKQILLLDENENEQVFKIKEPEIIHQIRPPSSRPSDLRNQTKNYASDFARRRRRIQNAEIIKPNMKKANQISIHSGSIRFKNRKSLIAVPV